MRCSEDVVVVGSGASAVHIAQRLLDEGRHVTMLDVGDVDTRYRHTVPDRPFAALRRQDENQYRYLLGDDWEGIDLGATGALAQATPPRQHVFRLGAERLLHDGDTCAVVESLARGGLAETWGAGAFPFTATELARTGLDAQAMSPHYEAVVQRIGVSGAEDDLSPWRGPVHGLQAPLSLDPNGAAIFRRYERERQRLHALGIRVGRPLLAVLSRSLGERRPNPLFGLDFLSNSGGSVFRPTLLLDSLQDHPHFSYRPGMFVTRFVEQIDAYVDVVAREVASGSEIRVPARRLILAAGALGTARIVLRSLDRYDTPVPFVCNDQTYIPALRLAGLGSAAPERAHALAQLTAMFDPTGDQQHLAQAQIFSMTGLPLAKLLKASPLAYRESIPIFRALASSFVVMLVQHEDLATAQKYCLLRRGACDETDVLEVHFRQSPAEVRSLRIAERSLASALWRLGCSPLPAVHPGHGSSIHYAGMFPTSTDGRPLTVDPDGRLSSTRRVHVGDGASFAYLPAKGPTLTLMANADRIAKRVARLWD